MLQTEEYIFEVCNKLFQKFKNSECDFNAICEMIKSNNEFKYDPVMVEYHRKLKEKTLINFAHLKIITMEISISNLDFRWN